MNGPPSLVEVVIASLGDQGDGLAHHAGRRLIVPGGLPGERHRVRLRPGSDVAESVDFTPGPDRVVPACPHFGPCGGCVSQHLAPAAEQAWKLGRVRLALARRGLAPAVVWGHQSPLASRRRLRLAVAPEGLGLRGRASHRVVPIQACVVARPELVGLLPPLARTLPGLACQPREVTLTAYADGVELVVHPRHRLTLDDRERLVDLAATADLARVALRGPGDAPAEPVVVHRQPRLRWPALTVAPPPGPFLQATAEAEAFLQGEVAAALAGARRVIDLFAGIGTLAAAARATGAAVEAVERDEEAVATLRAAGVPATARDLARRPLVGAELQGVDAVVLDPPRAGAAAQVEALASSPVARVVYVACAPSSFARDAATLVAAGFRLDRVAVVDQFRFAAEVELVAVLTRERAP